LHIYGLIYALGVVFTEKRETNIEDTQYLIKEVLNTEETLNMIEMLNMYYNAAIIYQTTFIFAQTLLLLHNKGELTINQEKIVLNTTIFLWNFYLIVSGGIWKQEKLIVSPAVALIVTGNLPFSRLISRIIPKPIIKKMQLDKNMHEWKADNWKDFFKMLKNDHMTATEQWNEECRKELRAKLKDTALDFFAIKYSPNNKKMCWNYEEFYVEYKYLKERCMVGKYYLRDLLKSCNVKGYYLNENIMKPLQFCQVLLFIKVEIIT